MLIVEYSVEKLSVWILVSNNSFFDDKALVNPMKDDAVQTQQFEINY